METAWADRREPGPLDAVLAGMVDALGYYFERRGLWQLGDRWNERAIALRRGSDPLRMTSCAGSRALPTGAVCSGAVDSTEEAVTTPRESLQLYEKAASTCSQAPSAASLHELAIIERDQGNPAEARRLLQQSLGIGATRRPAGQSASLHELAMHRA